MAAQRDERVRREDEYLRDLERNHLSLPFHHRFQHRVAPTPEEIEAPYGPFLWRWAETGPRVMQSAEIMKPGPDAHRRIVALSHPGTPKRTTTHTLSASVQLVLPGEEAPSHHHSLAAIRFVLEGRGVTLVDGEPCTMNPGDLILTPAWAWHGHANRSDAPLLWLDVLDAPVVRSLFAGLYEDHPEAAGGLEPATKAADDSVGRFGAGVLRPAWRDASRVALPLLRYPWEQTERALRELARVDASAFDDVALAFTNPTTGGPVLPTLSCGVQLLRPGVHTRAHRHASSSLHQVVRGAGSTIVDGARLDWSRGDLFAIPPWSWHEHANASSTEEAILFGASDRAVLEALELYREDPYPRADGHQPVTGSLGES